MLRPYPATTPYATAKNGTVTVSKPVHDIVVVIPESYSLLIGADKRPCPRRSFEPRACHGHTVAAAGGIEFVARTHNQVFRNRRTRLSRRSSPVVLFN
jgi:hypothetical protein